MGLLENDMRLLEAYTIGSTWMTDTLGTKSRLLIANSCTYLYFHWPTFSIGHILNFNSKSFGD